MTEPAHFTLPPLLRLLMERAGGGADCDCMEGWGRHNGSCVQEGAPCGEGGVYQRPPSQPCSSGTCIPYTECPAFIQVQMHYKISPFNEL